MPSSAPVTSAATHPRTANTRGRPRIAWNSISSPAMKNSRTIPNLARAGRIPSIGCTSPIPLGPIATPRSSSITTIDNPKRALAKPTSGAIAAAARDTKMGGRGFRRMHPRLKARWRNKHRSAVRYPMQTESQAFDPATGRIKSASAASSRPEPLHRDRCAPCRPIGYRRSSATKALCDNCRMPQSLARPPMKTRLRQVRL